MAATMEETMRLPKGDPQISMGANEKTTAKLAEHRSKLRQKKVVGNWQHPTEQANGLWLRCSAAWQQGAKPQWQVDSKGNSCLMRSAEARLLAAISGPLGRASKAIRSRGQQLTAVTRYPQGNGLAGTAIRSTAVTLAGRSPDQALPCGGCQPCGSYRCSKSLTDT